MSLLDQEQEACEGSLLAATGVRRTSPRESMRTSLHMLSRSVTTLCVQTMTGDTNHGLVPQLTKACQDMSELAQETQYTCVQILRISRKQGNHENVTGKAKTKENIEKPLSEKAFRKIMTSLVTK